MPVAQFCGVRIWLFGDHMRNDPGDTEGDVMMSSKSEHRSERQREYVTFPVESILLM